MRLSEAIALSVIVGLALGVILFAGMITPAPTIHAQASSRFYLGAGPIRVGNVLVSEVRDNLTDTCYVVFSADTDATFRKGIDITVVQASLAVSDAQPCPD